MAGFLAGPDPYLAPNRRPATSHGMEKSDIERVGP
jgi:hypothetical protein